MQIQQGEFNQEELTCCTACSKEEADSKEAHLQLRRIRILVCHFAKKKIKKLREHTESSASKYAQSSAGST